MVPERAKMLAGLPYNPADAELTALRARARELLRRFNATPEADAAAARDLLTELLGSFGEESFIQPPFYCDYGTNFSMGARCFLNFNCVVLDVCPVELGDYVFLGPAVQLLTATHPLDSRLRRIHESGKPVRIGTDVWLGAGVIVCPGVTIGSRSVIGAGSVVTRDIPAGVLAVGNPARVVREIA